MGKRNLKNKRICYTAKNRYYDPEFILETYELINYIVDELRKVKYRYSQIFLVMLDGIYEAESIAKETGIPKSIVAKDIPIIRKLAQELYYRF